ncbi:MAG: hypothetical protein R3B57_01310 [Phycisphaerales bacterium]
MSVTRCVCADVSFERVLALREELDPKHELSEDEAISLIRRRTGAGSSCATCHPYLRVCLRTGWASVPVLTGEQIAELGGCRGPRSARSTDSRGA